MRNTTPSTPRRVRSAHESKSATVRAAAAAPSRRQQSKWQREQQQQRLLFIAVGVLAVLVLAIFGGGILYDNVVRANEVVAQVGPDRITATQLLDEVRPQARSLDAQAKQLGTTSNITSYVDQQKRGMPDQVLNDLVDQRLLKQEADRRGISVSAAELDDKERQAVADFQASSNPAPTPEPSPTTDPAATPAGAAPAAPTTPTPVPTLDTSAYGPALQQLLDRNGVSEADFRKQLEKTALRDTLQTAIGEEQVAGTQDQIHVRQIEALDESTAQQAQAQLANGADFADVAQQISVDGSSRLKGGDMGWFARGASGKSTQFEDAAFALQPGQTTTDLVQDTDGYHIIQMLEHDPARSVPADQLATQRSKAFDTWLSARRTQDVKLSFSPSEKDWVLSRIGVRP